jgi:phosphate transport system substrate-binding protein
MPVSASLTLSMVSSCHALIGILALICALLAGGESQAAAKVFQDKEIVFAKPLIIAGTGDSQALLRRVAERFERDHIKTGVRVEVPDGIGSGGGILSLKKGVAQLARTTRPLKKREHNGLLSIPFAVSPIVFAVHPSVTGIDDLTSEQILAIYSGKILNWSELGGVDNKIYVVNREHGDSSMRVLDRTVAKGEINWQVGKVFFSTSRAAKAVAAHPFTIGYLPLSIAMGSGLKVLSINGVGPEESAVVSGKYPHILYFELVAKKPIDGWEKKFIKYLFSPKIRSFMLKIGVYPIVGGVPPGL